MASTLIAIKSELLLPSSQRPEDEKNPTKQLIDRLEQYAKIKHASQRIDALMRLERDVFLAYASLPNPDILAKEMAPYPATMLADSLIKMQLKPDYQMHHVKADIVPLAERMASISCMLASRGQGTFHDILDKSQGKLGVVVSFVAILELAKQRMLKFVAQEDDNTSDVSELTLIWASS